MTRSIRLETFGQGKYYFLRDHNSPDGWSIRLTGSDVVIANVCDKNYAALIAELLNKFGNQYEFLDSIESEIKDR